MYLLFGDGGSVSLLDWHAAWVSSIDWFVVLVLPAVVLEIVVGIVG